MHGRESKVPEDILFGPPATLPQDHNEYATDLAQSMTATFEHLKIAQREVRWTQRDLYDSNQHPSILQDNDLVVLYKPSRQVGLSTKFLTHWSGPFKMVRRVHKELHVIEELNTHARQSVYVQRLARYFPYADTSSTGTLEPVQPEPDNAPPPPLECDVGDYIIVNDDSSKWHLAEAIETNRDSEVTVHFLRTYNTTAALHRRSYKLTYVDPQDGKQVFTNRPLPRYQAVSAIISKDRIWQKIQLTKSGHITLTFINLYRADSTIQFSSARNIFHELLAKAFQTSNFWLLLNI